MRGERSDFNLTVDVRSLYLRVFRQLICMLTVADVFTNHRDAPLRHVSSVLIARMVALMYPVITGRRYFVVCMSSYGMRLKSVHLAVEFCCLPCYLGASSTIRCWSKWFFFLFGNFSVFACVARVCTS